MFLKHDAHGSANKVSTASGRISRRRRGVLFLSVLAAAATIPAVSHWQALAQSTTPPSVVNTDLTPVAKDAPVVSAVQNMADPTVAILAAQAQPMSNDERFKKGLAEFNAGKYEEALSDLQQVRPEELIARDRTALADTLRKAEDAANQRKTARAEFERGEQALAASNPLDALGHYKSAQGNRFADEGTKAKAREQQAVAENMMKQPGQSMKDIYDQAINDYRANNLAVAKTKFDQLNAAGYRAGLFQKSPADYSKEIAPKLAAMPAPAPAVAQTTPPPAPAPTPAVTPAPTPAPIIVVEPTPAPIIVVAPTPAPTPTPAVVAQPEPTTPSAVAQIPPTPPPVIEPTQPATTPPPPAPAIVVTPPFPTPNTELPPPAPAVTQAPSAVAPMEVPPAAPTDAKTAYRIGREQYNKGDWIAARKNLELARDMGYKPGLFEESPVSYLKKMDAKEQRDAAIAASQGNAYKPLEQRTVDAGRAQSLVSQAETSRAAGRLEEALALYVQAAEIDPSNNAARQGRDQLAAEMNRLGTQTDLLLRQQIVNQQIREYITYQFHTSIADANKHVNEGDYNAAQASLDNARVASASNTGVFTPQEIASFNAQIVQTQNAITSGQIAQQNRNQQIGRVEGQRAVEQTQMAIDEERRRTISDLVQLSRRQTEEHKYKEALATLDQILVLDPNNDYAQGAKPLVEDRVLVLDQRGFREQYQREAVKWYNSAEELKIPYFDILRYPTNWPDLSALRERTTSQERGQKAEDQEVLAKLDRKLPEIKFDAVGFNDVVEFLRDVSSANIFVNWRALETAGVDRTTPVTARLRDVKFSKALDIILRDVGGGNVKMNYTVDEGVITISTADDLASNVTTNVYDIRDLIVNVQDFTTPPNFNIQQTPSGRGGGGGGNVFQGAGQQNNTNQNTRQMLVDEIVNLIRETVASESWKDNGGSVGSIRELAGQLIVTQTPENQRQLSRLLEQLRETRAIQITVETRFLTVQRNFLEEVGVDFDVLFPSGQIFSQVGPVAIANNTLAYPNMGNLTTSIPGNIATDLAASSTSSTGITPNLGLNNGTGGAITFLDDFQVSILIQATQIHQNTTTLTSPRLTLFNGQIAYVAVATDTAYVSDLQPVVASSAVAFDPTISTLSSGVLLYVQATVSSDRKYVTLTIQPTLTRLRALVPFPVNAVVNVPGVGGGAGSSQISTGFIQQPVLDTTTLATTVSVPDGGTLLLGGQTLAGEIERESGVPILSKIPFLKRLFTNTGTAKDEQVLLILVKPTIIIQREREQEQFPLSSR